jgi:hypothetical protein
MGQGPRQLEIPGLAWLDVVYRHQENYVEHYKHTE